MKTNLSKQNQSKQTEQITRMTSKLLLSQLVSFCMRRGYSADDLFRHAGYDLAQLRIGQRLLVQRDFVPLLTSLAEQSQQPDIALQLGQDIHSEQMGVFGALVSSSPNLTVAVQRFSEFNQLLDDRFQLSLYVESSVHGDKLWLIYESHASILSEIDTSAYYSELLFSAVAAHAKQFSRLDATPLSVEFTHAQPDYAAQYHQYFNCAVTFSSSQNRMQLPMHLATAPFSTQDSRYHAHALAEARKLLPEQQASYAEQVTAYLRIHLADAAACQLERASAFVLLSSRSLQRELKAEGTSFSQLLDHMRETVACEQLVASTASIESIGQSVGFDYPSSFAAKFKRWTGQTPRQYRQAHQKKSKSHS